MSKSRSRVVAVVFVIFFVASILFSVNFSIENAHHKCTGDNCPICLEIAQAIQFVSNIKILPTMAIVLGIVGVVYFAIEQLVAQIDRTKTLITLKVELLN